VKCKFPAAVFAVLVVLCAQAAAALELRFRNDFDKKMYATVVYFDASHQEWRTLGWFATEPRSESKVILNASKSDVYIYAELSDASMTWGNGDIIRTVIDEPFSYFDREACPSGVNSRNVRLTRHEAGNGTLDFRPRSRAVAVPPRNVRRGQTSARTPYSIEPYRVDPAVVLLNLINAERGRAGVPYLRLDENVSRAADRRAYELIRRYAHDRPDGRGCRTVFAEFGLAPRISAENVTWRSDRANTSMEAFNKVFMDSPAHRSNMLNRDFTTVGLGFARHGDRLYVAELFTGDL